MLAFNAYEDSNEKMCIRTSLPLQYVISFNKYASLYIDHILKIILVSCLTCIKQMYLLVSCLTCIKYVSICFFFVLKYVTQFQLLKYTSIKRTC